MIDKTIRDVYYEELFRTPAMYLSSDYVQTKRPIEGFTLRCPECGGELVVGICKLGTGLIQCKGCTALYDINDINLLPLAFPL